MIPYCQQANMLAAEVLITPLLRPISRGITIGRASEVFNCYAASKQDIAHYFDMLQRNWPQLSEAAVCYARLAQLVGLIVEITNQYASSEMVQRRQSADLIRLFTEAQRTEEIAIQSLKVFMQETVDNRYNDISLR